MCRFNQMVAERYLSELVTVCAAHPDRSSGTTCIARTNSACVRWKTSSDRSPHHLLPCGPDRSRWGAFDRFRTSACPKLLPRISAGGRHPQTGRIRRHELRGLKKIGRAVLDKRRQRESVRKATMKSETVSFRHWAISSIGCFENRRVPSRFHKKASKPQLFH